MKHEKDLQRAIEKNAPGKASPSFANNLKSTLMKRHQKIQEASVEEKPSMFSWFHFGKLATVLGALVLIVFGSVLSYTLVPAPQVQGYILKEANREVSFNAPIKVPFSQPMDHGSVEKAFQIDPDIEGEFSWEGNTLLFTPKEQFEIDDSFKVTVGKTARSLLQKPLKTEYIENFVIVKAPEIVLFTPEAGSDEIPTDAKITMMFDRPIVPFTTLENASTMFPEFEIEPQVNGRFKWLGTSAVQFIPDELELATFYTVRVPAGLEALDGGLMEDDAEFTFQTVRPKFQSFSSSEGNDEFISDSQLRLSFNQKMDLNSVSDKVKIYKYTGSSDDFINPDLNARKEFNQTPGGPERVSFRSESQKWEEVTKQVRYQTAADYQLTQRKISERIEKSEIEDIAEGEASDEGGDAPEQSELEKTVILEPEGGFDLDAIYIFEIESGIAGVVGDLKTAGETITKGFYTVGEFEVLNSEYPGDYRNPYFMMTNAVDLRSFKDKIKVSPLNKDDEGKEIEPEITLSGEFKVVVNMDYQPSTSYTIELMSGVKDVYGNELAEGDVLTFETPARSKSLSLKSNHELSVLDGSADPIFYVETVNLDYVDVQFKALTEEEFQEAYKEGYFRSYPNAEDYFDLKVRVDINHNFNERKISALELEDIVGEPLINGFYYINITHPEIRRYSGEIIDHPSYFHVTDSTLAAKQSSEELLVWATDMVSGQPIEGMAIQIINNQKDETLEAVTDENGLVRISTGKDPERAYEYNIYGRKDGDVAFVNTSWSEGVSPWYYNIDFDFFPPTHFMYMYTDRPIYRPGHEVFFKGILRTDNDAKFSLPKIGKVDVVIYDAQGNEILNEEKELSENGTFEGKLQLGENISIGTYDIVATLPDVDGPEWQNRFYASFKVAEYRKPEYRLDLETSADEYVNQDIAEVEVSGAYFFGAPLPNADVRWTVKSQDYYFFMPDEIIEKYAGSWFSFSEEGYFCYWGCEGESELVSEGEATLDENGNYKIELPLQIGQKKMSQIYTVEVTVTEANNQTVSNRISFPVHQGEFYVGIRNKSYLNKVGEETAFELLTIKPDGAEVTGQQIEVSIFERKWNTIKRKNLDGYYYFENNYEDVLVDSKKVRSGEKGLSEVSFTMSKGGSYKAVAKAVDGRGNDVITSTSFYVTSSDYVNWGRDNNDQIELIPDKQEYVPGETAKILIKSPYTNVKALLTQERAGFILPKIIDIESNSQVIEIPIDETDIPNRFVSVLIVKGSGEDGGLSEPAAGEGDERNAPAFKLGYATLNIATESKKLDIVVTPDREKYHPGEEVTLTVKSTDFEGAPIPADISIAVVDESVLTLTQNVTADLINIFYRKRYLGVMTSHSLTKALARINVQVQAGLKGGGGGADGRRSEFKDTAHYEATVKTDASGEATVTFVLPDNLTTWQVLAIGISDDTSEARALVGSYKTTFIANKDLMTRPVLPRFVSRGDKLKIGAIVHNYLDEKQFVKVSLKSNLGENFAEKYVNLESEGSEKVEWEIEVDAADLDEAEFEFAAEIFADDGVKASDVVLQKLPIHEASFPTVVASADVISDMNKHVESVWLPLGLDTKYGELKVSATPTLAGMLDDGIEYLVQFPYGCTEQLSSALLSNVAVKKLGNMDKFDMEKIDEGEVRDNVEAALQGLYENQQSSGGFGLWMRSDSNAYITAYALYGMDQARQAGYSVDQNVMNSAVSFLDNYLKRNVQGDEIMISNNTRSFIVYVLAERGASNYLSFANNLYDERDTLNLFAKAYLAMALQKMSGDQSKIDQLISEMNNAANHTQRGVNFSENSRYPRLFDSNLRTTALVMQAMNRVDSENPLIPKILRSLLMERKDGHYASTQETAVALLAMIEYLETSGELDAAYNAFITLNGESVIDQKFSSENIFDVAASEVKLSELQKDNVDNDVAVWKNGAGNLYFDMNLKYYLPLEKVVSLDQGFQVTQEYFAVTDTEETESLQTLQLGENYHAKTTIVVPEARYYVMIEDFLPAGLEGIDFTLETSERGLQDEVVCDDWDCWSDSWRFVHNEVRDDRVMYFADYLPAGVYEIDYFVRATSPGVFADLPVLAQETYFPEVFGRNEGKLLVINE